MYMNLEGTKHEKAVLVVLAYIIGLTSGFIGFGVTQAGSQALESTTPNAFIPEGYTPPDTPPPSDESAATAGGGEVARYEDGKLYAYVHGDRFVLSLSNEVMPVENVEGFATQGIHKKIPTYSSSADGNFVHFCEQQTDADECTHFIFDATENVIQPVSFDGKKFITTISDALTAAWNGDTITIGSYSSAAAITPWKLQATE
ncbi:MAG: hypothetical protein RLZZ360_65 [Candidatus Parcubacteria bacterium]|jgi:hypothetical protein